MLFKLIRMSALVAGGALLTGGLIFGSELSSYVRSSARSLRASVRENVPVEFEIRRARDLLEGIGPEIHQSVRAIAEQEVEVAALKRDIDESKLAVADERARVQKLRDAVATGQTSFTFGDMSFSRAQITQELARRFNHLKEAQTALATKEQLLESRQKSLLAAQEALENAKSQQSALAAQIEGLEAQHKLVLAASQSSSGAPLQLDQSKLAQAKRVIGDIRKHLEVAERVLAHEAKFTPVLPAMADAIDEKDLVGQVDAHLGGAAARPAVASKGPANDDQAGGH
jgi:chromosome segregation ATPase